MPILAVERSVLPATSLLHWLQAKGAFVDCYVTDVAASVTHADYVEAFYTTTLFSTERIILRWLVSQPSTDAEARELARGERDSFSAWRVAARAQDQVLLQDFSGRTASWLMTGPGAVPGHTRLYFGSAVMPEQTASSGPPSMPRAFRWLMGFHRLYSKVLLVSARARLLRRYRR